MIYGYLRVSSDDQDVNSQKQGVDSLARAKGWTIDSYVNDEGVSGGKDPAKRNLGPLLKTLKEGDIVIASEISRLGRDLYMVMDILHYCMKIGCKIYTVKDNFTLGDDIQSKVLAFAFGLSAEIERQMIRQRTKEGLRLRMKMGSLVGRPLGSRTAKPYIDADKKEKIIEQYKWGVPLRRIAKNFAMDRNTIARYLFKWGITISNYEKSLVKQMEAKDRERRKLTESLYYGDIPDCADIPRDTLRNLIENDLTIPQIANVFPDLTYDQVYYTILCDREFNPLYRKHGQLNVAKTSRKQVRQP